MATFVRESCRPSNAEEGLTGLLSSSGASQCLQMEELSDEELLDLDSEGRCVVTEHDIEGRSDDSACIHAFKYSVHVRVQIVTIFKSGCVRKCFMPFQ